MQQSQVGAPSDRPFPNIVPLASASRLLPVAIQTEPWGSPPSLEKPSHNRLAKFCCQWLESARSTPGVSYRLRGIEYQFLWHNGIMNVIVKMNKAGRIVEPKSWRKIFPRTRATGLKAERKDFSEPIKAC